jgi:hypothetical protein
VTLRYTGPAGPPRIFRCTGGASDYTVPAGVTSLSVVASGAAGGSGPFLGGHPDRAQLSNGGRGAVRKASVDVTPGATLSAVAGCRGGDGARASDSWITTDGGGGGFGLIAGGGGGQGKSDGFAVDGGGGGGGASGLATKFPLTANGDLLLALAGGGGGGDGRYGDGGNGGAGGAHGTAGTGLGAGGGGSVGEVGGLVAGAQGGAGHNASTFTYGGGGGGGGGGLQGGNGGGGGDIGGGGGSGGAGGNTALANVGVTLGPAVGYGGLGSGDGVVLITPVWGKPAPTTTTVSVPTGAAYDGTEKVATATTRGGDGAVLATPPIEYSPGPGTPVNAGSYTASASYPGDDSHLASAGSETFTIAKAASQTKVSVEDATFDGERHGATATATGAGRPRRGADCHLQRTHGHGLRAERYGALGGRRLHGQRELRRRRQPHRQSGQPRLHHRQGGHADEGERRERHLRRTAARRHGDRH